MTLGLYLSRMLGARILAAGLVLLLLGLGFDLLSSADALIERGGLRALGQYAWLRLPLIATTLFPIAVLTGATVAFLTLAARSELTVIRAAGQGIFSLLARLLPLALLMGLLYSQLSDRLSAWAETGLTEAFPPKREGAGSTDLVGAMVWARYDGEVVRGRLASADGTRLEQVTIYRLDEDGHLAERVSADSATYRNPGWALANTAIERGEVTTTVANLDWPTRLMPMDMLALAEGRRTASSSDARAVLAGQAAPTRGRAYYSTRIARSYVAYAVPAVMLLLASLAAFGSARAGGGARLAVMAFALGFLYVALDGFFASLGEVGAMGPRLAAFAPSVLFAIAGAWAVLVLDG